MNENSGGEENIFGKSTLPDHQLDIFPIMRQFPKAC